MTARVELRGIGKSFGECVANRDVYLTLKRGSIHGLVGENGAGKSTAMKMLYGSLRPDSGQIFIDGKEVHWRSVLEALAAGIGMVHQHFMLADDHSVLDNLLLAHQGRAFSLLDRSGARKHFKDLGKRYGLEVPLDEIVGDLPVGMQQRTEILKLLDREADILILDEPTAVLTPLESKELFANLRKLREQGKSIIIITHKLEEVMELCDEVTVMRSNTVVANMPIADVKMDRLAALMVGHEVSLNTQFPPGQPKNVVLSVKDLYATRGGRQILSGISIDVRAGEIVGLAGVEGNGQSELLAAIMGIEKYSGSVNFLGRNLRGVSATDRRQLGIGYVPPDRMTEGLLTESSAVANAALGHTRGNLTRMSWRALRKKTRELFEEFDVQPRDIERKAGAFSGGNQQKLLMAREFYYKPKLLLIARPTRGVDVGAIEHIHRKMIAARDEGAAILLVSSDLDEICALSDIIYVMFEGRLMRRFERGGFTMTDLGEALGGVGHA